MQSTNSFYKKHKRLPKMSGVTDQKDKNAEAHIFAGIVAYQMVHAIRRAMKQEASITVGDGYATSCHSKRQ